MTGSRRRITTFVDLDETWPNLLDTLLTSPHFTRFVVALFALVVSLVLVYISQQQQLQQRVYSKHNHQSDLNAEPKFEPSNSTDASFRASWNYSAQVLYSKLASLYLAPFHSGISDSHYLPIFHDPLRCSGCFLVQVVNYTLYIHDPRGVRALMPAFRALRMREAIFWIRNAVERKLVNNIEMVISTADGVASTLQNHEYSGMPLPHHGGAAIFTIATCNVSANIPFPMTLVDGLRRGLDKQINTANWLATFPEWIAEIESWGKQVNWSQRDKRAIFRGQVRESAWKRQPNDEEGCEKRGRGELLHRTHNHQRNLKKYAWKMASRRRIWPLPTRWFLNHHEHDSLDSLLDVQISGLCNRKRYQSDQKPLRLQAHYKYVIHAEGHSFWADRLPLHLFGSSLLLKQHTPCGTFFEPLLIPDVHYVPIDAHFQTLALQTLWASQHDAHVRQIIHNAHNFATNFLTLPSIQSYVDTLLMQYQKLLTIQPIPHADAIRVHP